MAALFNIPTTSPFTSPLRPHVYGRVTSSTPSSPHDSHSTLFTQSSIPDQDRGSLEPPQKRTRLNKDIGLSIESHPESILPDTVISALVRSDGPLLPAASNPHPTLHGPCTQEQSSLDRDTSSGSQSVTFTPYDSMRAESMFRRTRDWTIYEFFARISSWPAMSGSDVSKCGFCQLVRLLFELDDLLTKAGIDLRMITQIPSNVRIFFSVQFAIRMPSGCTA